MKHPHIADKQQEIRGNILKCYSNVGDVIEKAKEEDNLQKAEVQEGRLEENADYLWKGEIMDQLGYGYGSENKALKFTKTGAELKEALPKTITDLQTKKATVVAKMALIAAAIGVQPSEVYRNDLLRYSWAMCEAPHDKMNHKEEPSEQNLACRDYNDLCYVLYSLDEDIQATEVILANVEDKKKYELTVSQLIALNLK